MSYVEAWVVCDGAMDSDGYFDTVAQAEKWLRNEIAMCAKMGIHAEGFYLVHNHELDGEDCVCAQYETDHSAYVTTDNVVQ